jgi:trk system potassium uptake protein
VFVLIVGSGRVGSTVAKRMIESGHEVSVLDESPEAHARLDHGSEETWEELGGRFTVGTALEVDALMEAGIEQADVVICSTDGDNTNIVVAQIAQKRFNVPKVLARVLDPYRADWYRKQGLETVCPTQSAIEMLTAAATARQNGGGDPLMEETR